MKIVKQIKFEDTWGKPEIKTLFPDIIMDKIFGTNSSFHVK